jgi:hypothetical protein
MRAPEVTAGPLTALEREVVHVAVRGLAGDAPIVHADALTDAGADATALANALRDAVGEESVVACVGVLEHLTDFSIVVDTLVSLASERRATVVLAVPNDAANGGAATAGRPTTWTTGAVAELRRLLPAEHIALDVVGLRGAVLVAPGERIALEQTIEPPAEPSAAIAFVVAFGPRARHLGLATVVAAADMRAERNLELARQAELDVLRSAPLADDSAARGPRPDAGS